MFFIAKDQQKNTKETGFICTESAYKQDAKYLIKKSEGVKYANNIIGLPLHRDVKFALFENIKSISEYREPCLESINQIQESSFDIVSTLVKVGVLRATA